MPETPETHKEVVEIKRAVREIRQTQDAEIYHNREKWEGYIFKLLKENTDMMRVLLSVDGNKSAEEVEKECGFYKMKCWRLLNQLEREGIIFKLEDTKNGSPIYAKSRWYTVLRLDEKVQKKLTTQSVTSQTSLEQKNVDNQPQPRNSTG